MTNIILRKLADEVAKKLRQRAARTRRSLSAELKRQAADIRALSAGRRQTPSEESLRESRDRR